MEAGLRPSSAHRGPSTRPRNAGRGMPNAPDHAAKKRANAAAGSSLAEAAPSGSPAVRSVHGYCLGRSGVPIDTCCSALLSPAGSLIGQRPLLLIAFRRNHCRHRRLAMAGRGWPAAASLADRAQPPQGRSPDPLGAGSACVARVQRLAPARKGDRLHPQHPRVEADRLLDVGDIRMRCRSAPGR
jgi:hypothetical protein